MAANWFSDFKTEFYRHHRFATHREAEAVILGYIESWYNRCRPNESASGYPPMHAWSNYQTSEQELLAVRLDGGGRELVWDRLNLPYLSSNRHPQDTEENR